MKYKIQTLKSNQASGTKVSAVHLGYNIKGE